VKQAEDTRPCGSALSDELGPDERAKLDALLDHIYEYGTAAEGVLRLAADLCQSSRAAERERCARLCEQTDEDGEGPDCWDWHSKDYARAIRGA
jgi:hypothetical protein